MNSTAKVARFTALGVSAVWAAILFLTGLDLHDNTRTGLSYLPSIAGLLVVLFDLWLWKLPGVSRLTGRPHLWGTWNVKLQPSAHALIPEGGNREAIPGVMIIEQTFWTAAVQFYTRESASSSISTTIVDKTDSKQAKSLLFTYANSARQEHRHRSHEHSGTCRLDVTGTTPSSLSGTYWTDRMTAGDMTLTLVDRTVDRARVDALAVVGVDPN
ncbi:hypothetical protein [Propioniciclava sinopodophylli]|uniref:Cap15 family cyclic dinucleotide receptor domain-containing protein n=1 Tax=Propioniciclava sinopodophylli TaxID=1837344 RepID=UPI00249040FD|nr:hypothetical protein [Propioniciclava sinopodophylli]